MHLFELSHIGQFHINHNEDYLITSDLGNDRRLIAVMDGCSSGTDSYLASTLIGKLLRKIAKQISYKAFIHKHALPIEDVLKTLALTLFDELVAINRILDLRSDEILSTLLLGIVDEAHFNATVMVVGDGIIHVNGTTNEYENDNKPDYLGYHLTSNKEEWFNTKTQRISFQEVNDISIATDGIFTFKNFDGRSYPEISEDQIQEAFFTNTDELDNPNKLKKTLTKLKEVNGLMPSDDLTMIRMVRS